MTNESKSWKDEKKKDESALKSAPDAKKSVPTAENPVAEKPVAEATPQVAAAADKPAAAKPSAAQPTPASAPRAPAQPAASPVGRQQVEVDDSEVSVCYANFCRVTGTPEELIIDFGLNTQPYGAPTKPMKVRDRVVLNMFTAKRMLHALHLTIQRHESAFGVLETDVQKRVVTTPQAAPAFRQQ